MHIVIHSSNQYKIKLHEVNIADIPCSFTCINTKASIDNYLRGAHWTNGIDYIEYKKKRFG